MLLFEKCLLVLLDARIRLDVHQRVCAAITEYAPGHGCNARREFPVPLGRIDVVWFRDEKLVVAFEVDQLGKKNRWRNF